MQVTIPTSTCAVASTATDWGLWAKRGFRLLLAGAVAAAIVVVITQARRGPLDVRTDIVGYPTFAVFNVNNYSVTYLGWTIAFPLLTLGGYVALGYLLRPWILRPTTLRGPSRTVAPESPWSGQRTDHRPPAP